jgi:hypothetical protein
MFTHKSLAVAVIATTAMGVNPSFDGDKLEAEFDPDYRS